MKRALFWLLLPLLLLADKTVLYRLDFADAPDGNAKPWLEKHGFELELDTKEMDLTFEDGRLVIETSGRKTALFGIQFSKKEFLDPVGSVRLEWGVERFPKGADWEGGNNRLAIGALFVLGTKKLGSGLPFGINAAPYFLGPFIGEKEKVGKRYKGALYRKGGRYYCVSNENHGKTVVTDFDIDRQFRSAFDKKTTPPLTAFGFQMNTKSCSGGAKAFVKSVTFYAR